MKKINLFIPVVVFFWMLAGDALASTITKNMVTDYGADNTGVADITTAFNNAIVFAKSNPANEVIIFFPAGTYKAGGTLYINNVAPTGSGRVIIRGAGISSTTLIFPFAANDEFSITDSHAITLEKFYMRRPELHTTQGLVVSSGGGHVVLDILSGFPDPVTLNTSTQGRYLLRYTKNDQANPIPDPTGPSQATWSDVAPVSGSQYQFTCSATYNPGDLIAVKVKQSGYHVYMLRVDGVTIDSVRMTHGSYGAIVAREISSNIKVSNVIINRPDGLINGWAPCLSEPGGGMRIYSDGLLIENCSITGTGDDGIALDGGTGQVVRNNTVNAGFARGILTQGTHGEVGDVTIEHNTIGTVKLYAFEFFGYTNSTSSHNLVIRGNTLNMPGAATAFAFTGTGKADITIDSNTVYHADPSAILIDVDSATHSLTINNNIIKSWATYGTAANNPLVRVAKSAYITPLSATGTGNSCDVAPPAAKIPAVVSAPADHDVIAFANTGTAGAPPTISYTSPSVFKLNMAITPLFPASSGGNIPPMTAQVSTLAGDGTAGAVNGAGATARFKSPAGVAVDNTGNVYVADNGNHRIRKIDASGNVSTIAGTGVAGATDGAGTMATFYNPFGVAVSASGNIYIGDRNNNKIRKIDAARNVSTLAGNGTAGSANGNGASASFNSPYAVAADHLENVYVADYANHTVRKVDASGNVSVYAGSGASGTVNGNGTSASFKNPAGVAVGSSGVVYVADRNGYNIRKIDASRNVTTIAGTGVIGSADGSGAAASFYYPYGVAADKHGHIYVADTYNQKIRLIDSSGYVSTLAGTSTAGSDDGDGSIATFNNPYGIAADTLGNIYVADYGNNKIRKLITSPGYTISPALPAGLHFDNATGEISGTPAMLSPETDYTVVAHNYAGNGSTTVTLSVVEPDTPAFAPPNLTLQQQNQTVKLSWPASHQQGNVYYQISRSSDGATFQDIGKVPGQTSANQKDYNYIDYSPITGNSHYQLTMVDTGNKPIAHTIRHISYISQKRAVILYPNPTAGIIAANFAGNSYTLAMLRDVNGNLLGRYNLSSTQQLLNVDLGKYQLGIYWLTLSGPSGTVVKKIMKL